MQSLKCQQNLERVLIKFYAANKTPPRRYPPKEGTANRMVLSATYLTHQSYILNNCPVVYKFNIISARAALDTHYYCGNAKWHRVLWLVLIKRDGTHK